MNLSNRQVVLISVRCLGVLIDVRCLGVLIDAGQNRIYICN